jgi:hypothetical protein
MGFNEMLEVRIPGARLVDENQGASLRRGLGIQEIRTERKAKFPDPK